ncbi:NACHT domain-containing NTPase [Xanthomonas sp. NCPPB 3005]|uniref:NACHT domain-containing protein n=1 Tax=Xanthomonas sp. NCPPB 3005 TaxID=3240913 RepID=UPI0035118BE0
MSSQDLDFENEVRRIARAKWPSAAYSGAAMLDGRERDGVFETEESINFIEATVSAGTGKAKDDTRKLFKAVSDYNKSGSFKAAIGWFVTKDEPTADQRKVVNDLGKGQVRAVSFSQFQQSIINVRDYLAARKEHFFGSVLDLSTGEKSPSIPYVEIGLSDPAENASFLIKDIARNVSEGSHYAIVGQYGAGKSMTLREIFFLLEERYINGKTGKFPVYINLREHSGQQDPIEILERHARSIGFDASGSLVRAWRAGFVILLVDGFDEVASLGVQGTWKKLKDLRLRSLEGVRKLIRDSVNTGVIACGRSNYFEADSELSRALGLNSPKILHVDEFSDTQMRNFLSRFSKLSGEQAFPSWLPTRPLLLGYLASRELLQELDSSNNPLDAIDGWDYLLDKIYQREERIETNLDGGTLRLILERVSTIARSSESGLGPISRSDLFSAFKEVCGYEPDEQGILAIQRLPGLGIYRPEEESRCFVDKELADVCRGRELSRFLTSPFDASRNTIWTDAMNTCDKPISAIGATLANRHLEKQADSRGLLRQAMAFLNSRDDLAGAKGDISMVIMHGNNEVDISMTVTGITYTEDAIEFTTGMIDLNHLSFSHCLFENIHFDTALNSDHLPYFDGCLFENISGRVSAHDLPSIKFSKSCDFSKFDSNTTSESIRSGSMTVGEKVLLVTLRKLFVQGLSGRAESALFRGLDVDERRCVQEILTLLKRHQLATEYSRGAGVVWLPARKALSRVKRILSAPSECGEQILIDARQVSR